MLSLPPQVGTFDQSVNFVKAVVKGIGNSLLRALLVSAKAIAIGYPSPGVKPLEQPRKGLPVRRWITPLPFFEKVSRNS